jgi:hypothetical protein
MKSQNLLVEAPKNAWEGSSSIKYIQFFKYHDFELLDF